MGGKRVELRIPAHLLRAIDDAARASLMTRSEFIRESIIMRLHDQHLVRNPTVEDMLEILRQAGRN